MKNNLKRAFYGLLTIFTVVAATVIFSSAPVQAASVSMNDAEGVPGQTVKIPVILASEGNIAGLQFDLEYDENVMACIGIEQGTLTAQYSISRSQVGTGKQRIVIYSPNIKLLSAGSGSIAVVVFQVKSGTGEQSCRIDINGVMLPSPQDKTSKPESFATGASFNVLAPAQKPVLQSGAGNQNVTANTPPVNQNPTTNTGSVANQANSPNTVTVSLKDVNNHWAASYINQLVQMKVLNGYEDGTFLPDKSITRAEFARVIAVALHLPIQTDTKLAFSDSDTIGEWARSYIAAAVQAGIVSGYDDHTFRPNSNITRAEMTAMVVRAVHKNASGAELSFIDTDSIPAWAQSYVKTAVNLGIIVGKTGNQFMPFDKATRAEASVMTIKIINLDRGM